MKSSVWMWGLAGLLLLAACKREEISMACGVADPAKELTWLQAIIDQAEAGGGLIVEIVQYRYQGESLFLVVQDPEVADHMDVVYDCEGGVRCRFGGIAGFNDCPDFFETALRERSLWRSGN